MSSRTCFGIFYDTKKVEPKKILKLVQDDNSVQLTWLGYIPPNQKRGKFSRLNLSFS
jgi:hypothetical protein